MQRVSCCSVFVTSSSASAAASAEARTSRSTSSGSAPISCSFALMLSATARLASAHTACSSTLSLPERQSPSRHGSAPASTSTSALGASVERLASAHAASSWQASIGWLAYWIRPRKPPTSMKGAISCGSTAIETSSQPACFITWSAARSMNGSSSRSPPSATKCSRIVCAGRLRGYRADIGGGRRGCWRSVSGIVRGWSSGAVRRSHRRADEVAQRAERRVEERLLAQPEQLGEREHPLLLDDRPLVHIVHRHVAERARRLLAQREPLAEAARAHERAHGALAVERVTHAQVDDAVLDRAQRRLLQRVAQLVGRAAAAALRVHAAAGAAERARVEELAPARVGRVPRAVELGERLERRREHAEQGARELGRRGEVGEGGALAEVGDHLRRDEARLERHRAALLVLGGERLALREALARPRHLRRAQHRQQLEQEPLLEQRHLEGRPVRDGEAQAERVVQVVHRQLAVRRRRRRGAWLEARVGNGVNVAAVRERLRRRRGRAGRGARGA